MTALKVIFMGTPDFAAVALKALVDAGHAIVAVYSQPPRPAGRGQELRKSPVQMLAEARGFPVRTPVSLKTTEAQAEFAGFKADLAVVAAYGLILPQAILDTPRRGCLNIHASLLPRWRGAAPIQRAILAGDKETGISIMQMDAGLDTGAVLLEKRIAIRDTETAGALHDRLAALGGTAIVEALAGSYKPMPQPADGVTYAAKISPEEARLDWNRPAADLARAVRAFNPVPGAWTTLPNGERLKILSALVADRKGAPGTLLDAQLTIACGEGALQPLLVQRQGKRAMETGELLRGLALKPGERFT
ncbi:methionyl-tRNA formyltransferase [Dongia sp.]|uniref:methionyl-tRNA formyltransferase n=1 Tax=Dongia sp. TaxID=1977262 RepID=UPI003752DD02